MTETHSATIELSAPAPTEVPVGATFGVKVRVVCAKGCDLQGLALSTDGPDGAGETRQAPSGAPEAPAREITFHAAQRVGEQIWRLSLSSQDIAGVVHEAEPLSISVTGRPHATSLAVWDIPSPVVKGKPFEIKAGAKSSGDYALSGRSIEVCDEGGAVIAQGRLGDTPWPGTSGLHWTPLALVAPDSEGTCAWSARFAASDLDLPHEGTSSNFSFAVARPAEHRLAVKVVEKDTASPIEDAEVRLGAYRATTDPSGIAVIELPRGTYELVVWKVGYDIPTLSTEVNADSTVQIEAVIVPEEDPDAIWQM